MCLHVWVRMCMEWARPLPFNAKHSDAGAACSPEVCGDDSRERESSVAIPRAFAGAKNTPEHVHAHASATRSASNRAATIVGITQRR